MTESPEQRAARHAEDELLTRSGRRLTPARRFLYRLGVPVGMVLIRFWWLTCRVVRVVGEEPALAAIASGPVLPVYWHQHQLFCTRYLLGLRRRGLKPGFLISPSVDGEIPAMIARAERTYVIRGSSSHTGGRALQDYYRALQQGVSPAITVDGPYGPVYEFKPGAVWLAQVSGRPILPLAFHASRAWHTRGWDEFVVPWPFARITIAVGEPRYVPKRLDAEALQRWQVELAAALTELYRTARAAAAAS